VAAESAIRLGNLGTLLDATIDGWRSRSDLHQTYSGPYAELVHYSGRVLQALTYAPTGAIVAAPELDASVLTLVLTGYLGSDDPRARATVEAIARGLTDERGFVYRYRSADGLEGAEGTFAICTFWLAQCFALIGDVERACGLFEAVVAHANDVGLLSEEIDSRTGDLWGNFPQAFTHNGLVNAAWAIANAERLAPNGGPTQ
jgi:GH15 family glucan-1,4-alpha-glucosidase